MTTFQITGRLHGKTFDNFLIAPQQYFLPKEVSQHQNEYRITLNIIATKETDSLAFRLEPWPMITLVPVIGI